ncbi:MAG: TetR/AcrR family transcriptional regulator [Steroidobacteraceae bacterium]
MKKVQTGRRRTAPPNREVSSPHGTVPQRAMRGRPKDKQIDEDVVLAVLDTLNSKGYRHVTIERIAKTVRRARTSLYRRWPSKRHLVAYAVVSTLEAEPTPDSGSLRQDLICAVDTLRRAFAGPLGQALPGLVADMAHDPGLAAIIRGEVLVRRRTSIRNAILRGIARAEIRRGIHIDVLIDQLTAPCYFRVLLSHARITRSFIETVVDYALLGHVVPSYRPADQG